MLEDPEKRKSRDPVRELEIWWDGCTRFAGLVNLGKADGGCQRSLSSGNADESE